MLTKNEMRTSTVNLKYIDALKGIAILLVVLVHFNQSFNAPNHIIRLLSGLGSHGVQFFFIISAFLLCCSYYKNISSQNYSLLRFVRDRISRVLPLYYVSLVVYIIMRLTIGAFGGLVIWKSVICHILLINGLIPNYINDLLGIEWYVADLFILYSLTPILLRIIKNIRGSIIAFVLSVILAFLVKEIYSYLVEVGVVEDGVFMHFFFTTSGFFVQFPCMAMGIVVYYLTKDISNKVNKDLIFYFGITFVILLFTIIFYLVFGLVVLTSVSIFSLIGGGMFIVSSKIEPKFEMPAISFVSKPLCYLGKHSYGIYLFHFIIIYYFSQYLQTPKYMLSWIGLFLIIVIMSLIIGNLLKGVSNVTVKFLDSAL